MGVNPVSFTLPQIDSPTSAVRSAPEVESAGGPESFGSTLKSAVKEVNSLQNQADEMAVKVTTGDIEDVHQAMVAMQKAGLALQFTVQVRNKVIEAYQSVMSTQV